MPHISKHSKIYIYLVFYVLIWTLIKFISSPNLDLYGDMLENFAWSYSFEWGTYKHPPLFAWVTGAWFEVFPQNNTSYYALAYFNSALGLLGIYFFSRAIGLERFALAAVLLMTLALPYSTLAGKFNANAILLSTWPWTAWAFVLSLKSSRNEGFWASVILGLFAALAMLGKYYSGVLLLALFLASLSSKEAKAWYTSYKPYLALVLFCVFMLPHAMWVYHHDFSTFKYVSEQGDGGVSYHSLFKFFKLPILYWIFPLFAVTVLTSANSKSPFVLFKTFFLNWKPEGVNDWLFYIAILPWLITLIFGAFGVVQLSPPWGIPMGFAYTILWLRNRGETFNDHSERKIEKLFWIGLLLSIIFSGTYAKWQSVSQHRSYYLPHQEMADDVYSTWYKTHPNVKLEWVGGAWPSNGAIAFYEDGSIKTTQDLPDAYPSLFSPVNKWKEKGGLLLCPYSEDATETLSANAQLSSCVSHYSAWVEKQGKRPEIIYIRVSKVGWRFDKTKFFSYAAVTFIP